ncbi:HD family phosphohydrolase [Pontibacillus salicampi]|uniref:HD family phosphohydrolase n=1 Tax=Pontibacillus salicampi TaxID=1449801 RepID=A0ABV6LJT4_9BACI
MVKVWWEKWKNIGWVQHKGLQLSGSLLLLAFLLFGLTYTNVQTKTYDIERFERAKETILSPITIEDKQKTNEKKSQAFQSVEDIYSVDESVTTKQLNYVNDLFKAIETIQDKEGNTSTDDQSLSQDQQLTKVLPEEITSNLDASVFDQLIAASVEQRQLVRELLMKEIKEVMNAGIKEEEVPEARQLVQEQLNLSSFGTDLKEAVYDIAAFATVENNFLDLSKTSQAKNQAANEVEPVMIRQGQVLVSQGERISSDIYQRLELVGLLDNKNNIFPYIGLSLLIVLSMGMMAYELTLLSRRGTLQPGTLLTVLLISAMSFLFMKIGSIFQSSWHDVYFAVPLAASSLLLKILIRERIAIVLSVVYAVFGTIFFNQQIPGTLNLEAGLFLLFSQISAVMLLSDVQDRLQILKTGFGVTVVNIVLVVLLVLLSYEPTTLSSFALLLLFGGIAAFLSSVLTYGLLPFFEAGLGMLTDTRLLILANPNHPLLRKILTETPGTYHHSVMVGNLSEAACEAIGANGLLARVGSYYHDLGKTYKPQYFIENQMGIKNPHDMIEPEQSAEIIIEHPYLGAETLRKHKMPQEIIDIAEQHHGTTLLKYFYYKAKEQKKHVSEHQFRYPGPKPQSKEAAIVCICDSVEAAVRSLEQPTPHEIEELVQSIIRDRLLDGQLHASPLTLKDLEKVQVAICETLNGIFHSRIQYPQNKQTVKEAT